MFDARPFFQNELYSDITLEFSCDGQTTTVPAHKMVLHQSCFFKAAINCGMREHTSGYAERPVGQRQ